jgi:GNAT superfamily N-acetyltransferase
VNSTLSSRHVSYDTVGQPGKKLKAATAEPSDYLIRWYQPEDKAGILRLNALQGGVSELAEGDYFDWLYERNPAGKPVLSVATEQASGRIVGFIWYIPMHWRYFGTSVLAFLGANALVHPDYRHRGIYSSLQAMTVEECIERGAALLYAFGRPTSIKPAEALGFETIHMPLLAKPFDMEQLAQARGFGPALQVALNLGWRLAEATIFRPQSARGSVTLRWEAGFDESFDQLWERVADKYPTAVIRDRVFLTWRFCSVPFRQYEILTARDGSELIGYAVLRCAEIQGVRTGLVMDLLVEPTARGDEVGLLLLTAATRRFREAGMWMATSLMLDHTQEYALLRRAGYVPCQRWLASRSYLLVVRGCSPQVVPGQMAGQIHDWFVTLINHDAC